MRNRGMTADGGNRRLTASPVNWNAEHVRALRAHLRMTQEEVAGLLGTRQQTISEWEVGRHQPRGTSVAMLTRLAESSGFVSIYMRIEPAYSRAER
jgi:putative transcriptional regulator